MKNIFIIISILFAGFIIQTFAGCDRVEYKDYRETTSGKVIAIYPGYGEGGVQCQVIVEDYDHNQRYNLTYYTRNMTFVVGDSVVVCKHPNLDKYYFKNLRDLK